MTDVEPANAATGAPTLPANEWLQHLKAHYLDGFIRDGGAAIKFVVNTDSNASALRTVLEAEARRRNYVVASLHAESTRVHSMDALLFAVCKQVPWQALCEQRVLHLVAQLGYAPPAAIIAGQAPGTLLQRLAEANQLTSEFLALPLRRQIQQHVFGAATLARDFRVAMSQLCLALLDGSPDSAPLSDITAWLTGTLTGVSQIKPYQIFARINRHAARHVFESLTHWLDQCGAAGLVVTLDINRLLDSKRMRDNDGSADGLHYSKANAMDTYELLRQFVDSTERLHRCLIVVTADQRFLQPDGKGVELYQALKHRVYDEVHDRGRANPLASLVRLTRPPAENHSGAPSHG